MRVALDVTPTLSGQTGVARYAQQLLAHLPAQGVDTAPFAVGRGSGSLPAATRHLRVPLRFVQPAWRRNLPPRAEALVGGADLVHSLDLVPPSTRRPLVSTVHDLAAVERPDLHPPRATAQQQRQLQSLHRAQGVITVSQATADALRNHGSSAAEVPVTVVHLASTLSSQLLAAPKPAGVAPYLLAVGELAARKDYPTLIRAFAAADVGSHQLVIAGPIGYRGEEVAAEVDRLNVGDRVRLVGKVDDASLAALYCGATALCLTSIMEGFGLPLVEAMTAGIPIVASDIDVVREIAGDAARLAPVGDSDGFAAAISTVTADAELRGRLRAAGLERSTHFSWDHTAQGTVETYRRVLGA